MTGVGFEPEDGSSTAMGASVATCASSTPISASVFGMPQVYGSATCSNSRCARDFGATGGALAFSERRARAVKAWCVQAGVDDDRILPVGCAGSRRIVEDTEGHNGGLNRRVEVHTIVD